MCAQVSEGLPCKFHQMLAMTDAEQGTLYALGNLAHKLVLSPDLETMLANQ